MRGIILLRGPCIKPPKPQVCMWWWGYVSEKTSQLQELNQGGCDSLRGWGVCTVGQQFRSTFIALNSGLVQLLRNCVSSDKFSTSGLCLLRCMRVQDLSSLILAFPDTALQPFSVLGRGKNIALELAGQQFRV